MKIIWLLPLVFVVNCFIAAYFSIESEWWGAWYHELNVKHWWIAFIVLWICEYGLYRFIT